MHALNADRQEAREWFDNAPPSVKAPTPPTYQEGAVQLWDRCVDDSESVYQWLHDRCIPLEMGEDIRGLNLPRRTVPDWARSWTYKHKAIVPLVDHNGEIKGLRARSVAYDAGVKELATKCKGLVMANRFGHLMLRGEPENYNLVIAEGVPDFLSWCAYSNEVEEIAVIGIFSGAWTQDIADRVPDDVSVFIRTHTDDTGRKYAAQIAATLPNHDVVGTAWCDRPAALDDNDRLMYMVKGCGMAWSEAYLRMDPARLTERPPEVTRG